MYQRLDFTRYVVVPIWYYCNSKCTFCMVERQIANLPTVEFATFQKMIHNIINEGRYDNLILSGAEVTIFDQLEKYVRYAASFGWFQRIQIQTNARRLANPALTAKLIDAGLNEFFISMHGREEVHDAVTRAKGGYKETLRGFENLRQYPHVNLMTNTVLNTQNFHDLVPLMEMLATWPTSEMHIWNYFPMAQRDTRELLVNLRDFRAVLPQVLDAVRPSGKPLVLKSFPECLSLGDPGIFDNHFPPNLIDNDFWDDFQTNGFGKCAYKAQCSAKICWGLSDAYVKKYGPELDLLTPLSPTGAPLHAAACH